MKRTTVLKTAAVLGVASLTLAACGGSSDSGETDAAASEPAASEEAPAEEPAEEETPMEEEEAPAAGGVPLYLVDGNTGNALGEKLPPGTLDGVKGTIPGAENTQDFKAALLEVDPELIDFAYAPESYDAVILAALAAAKAGSDAGVDMAKEMVGITNGTEICNDYAGCLALLEEGKDIDYNGRSGAVNFWDAGDPTSASIGVYQFGPDNTLLPEVSYATGDIIPEGDANPIDGKPQDGANDGVFKVGTFLPVTGNLAFLGPPEVAGVKLAIKDIEAAGGIPGFDKIELEEGDSGDTSTETGRQTVKRLLPLGIDILVGAASSGSSLQVLDEVTGAGVMMISPANTSPALTTAPDSGLYWRTAPSDVLQGAFVGNMMLQDGYTKVAIMSLQDAYGDGLNENITKAVTEGGGEVVANVVYDPTAADFAADVAQIKAAGPEAIVLIGFDESAQIIQEMVKQGIGPNAG